MRKDESIRLAVLTFVAVAIALFLPCLGLAGSLEPSGPPAPTMKTLDQIPPTWDQVLPASERFVLVMGGAGVLDKETGLVWEAAPSTTRYDWDHAQGHCYTLVKGGRKGWHLPTIKQLASLVDTTNSNPSLPTGHPFTNVQSDYYWSSTTFTNNPSFAWDVHMGDGRVDPNSSKTFSSLYVWCVRGGPGVDVQ